MTGYGPPGPPQGPPPGYGAVGGPLPGPPKPPLSPQQRLAVFGYVGAGLGVLAFIWGFLDWVEISGASDGFAGFASSGTGAIAVILLAAVLATADALEKKPPSLLPGAAAVAGLLITFGIMVSVPDGEDVEVGLILTLITSILQAGVLVFAWLSASGRIAQRPAQSHFGGPPPGYGGPSGPPPGYGPPPGGGFGPPPAGYGPPPQ